LIFAWHFRVLEAYILLRNFATYLSCHWRRRELIVQDHGCFWELKNARETGWVEIIIVAE
jgi:hypothetical protein